MIRDLLGFAAQLALEGAVHRLQAALPPEPKRAGVIETRQRADGTFEPVPE